MTINYPKQFIKDILTSISTIAVVGGSSNKNRDSYKVMEFLIACGYKVIPINPYESGNSILGQYCYSSISDVKESIDMINIFRKKDAVIGITREAINLNIEVIWMQENIVDGGAEKLAKTAGIKVVMDRCTKKELIKLNLIGLKKENRF